MKHTPLKKKLSTLPIHMVERYINRSNVSQKMRSIIVFTRCS